MLVNQFLIHELPRHAQHRHALRQWQRRDGRHHEPQFFVCCCVHFCPALPQLYHPTRCGIIFRTMGMGVMNLRSLLIALCIAPAAVAAAQVNQPVPTSLPEVTLDCYQSYATITVLPESAFTESAIDGDNFDTPTPRYRLQVVDKTTLKIIRDPTLPARRTGTCQ
jgi:hypothetical protein